MCMRWVDMLHKMCNALATLHTLNFKQALAELDGIELSPNLAEINKHLTSTKDRLDLDQTSKNFVIRTGIKSPHKGMNFSPSKETINNDHTLSSTKILFA